MSCRNNSNVYKYKTIKGILEEFLTPTGLDYQVNNVLDAIKRLTPAQVDTFKTNPTKFQEWIVEYLKKAQDQKLKERGLAYADPVIQPPYRKQPAFEAGVCRSCPPAPAPYYNASGYLAGVDPLNSEQARMLLAQAMHEGAGDAEFEYLQGFEFVGGMPRGMYLNKIVNARPPYYFKVENGGEEGGEDEASLVPIKVEKEVNGRKYAILLDKIVISPTGGTLDAYLILEVPNTGQEVMFRATNVPFTPGGLGPASTKLSLQSDVHIRLNNTAKLIIKGQQNETFVEWDCNGFKQMGIKAEIEFCREFLTPLKPDLEIDTTQSKRVKGYFTAVMPSWGEFVASITMDKFAVTKHQDYKWEIQSAVLDFSDGANHPDFVDITPNYYSEFKNNNGTFSSQWKGFFLRQLKVTLPKKFSKEGAPPVSINVEKLIIDDRGLTGLVTVNAQVLSLEDGNLGGWAYSIDELRIAVVANRIQGGGFGGWLNIPIFSQAGNDADSSITAADCFRYSANIIGTPGGERYEFSVTPGTNSKKVNIMLGSVVLDPTTFVKVQVIGDSVNILANLTGKIVIDGNTDSSGTQLKLPEFNFQDVLLANQAPYFRGGTMGIGGSVGASFGGFGLKVILPELGNGGSGGTSRFRVGAEITLVGDTPSDLSANLRLAGQTTVSLIGELKNINGRQRWKYQRCQLEEVSIAASIKLIELKGSVNWYEGNPQFGKGFRGQLSMKLPGLKSSSSSGGFGIQALAQFGKINDYKYFFVDALLTMNPGIDLGGLSIRGFGGGVYYHMSRDTTSFASLDTAQNYVIIPSVLGQSLSGIKYLPNPTIKLGVKATVIVATTKEEVFNGAATFAIEFVEGGGVSKIELHGAARMLSKIKFGGAGLFESTPTMDAPISATLFISYDFGKKTLHGELGVFANIQGALSGTGPGFALGKAVIHFDPQKWYINVGTPVQPLGVQIGIPISGLDINLLKAKIYFCVGTGIPPMPPLPAYVREMTGADNFMVNENRRATGQGFAMGASIEISTGEATFLIFYGHLDMGLGFDLMLQKYDSIYCPNNNNEMLGVNGWYAAGQAWAYVDAEIGVKYKQKRFPIMDIGAAAVLQMKLPNPFWARGAVGGRFSILGGLVKGNCNFKFTIGKNCDHAAEENDAQYVQLIEALEPADQAENVEVNTLPIAHFGVPFNAYYNTYNEAGEEIKYDPFIRMIELKDSTGNKVNLIQTPTPGDRRSLPSIYSNFLKAHTRYYFTVKMDLVDEAGVVVKSETKSVTFRTGAAPRVIPPSNIKGSYPVDGMFNLYRKEHPKGFLSLKVGQSYLLAGVTLQAHFSLPNGSVVAKKPVQLMPSGNYLQFDMPDNLLGNQVYRMTIVHPGWKTSSETGGGEGAKGTSSGGNATPEPVEQIYYTAYFRTSTYNTFGEKLLAFRAQATQSSQEDLMSLTHNAFEPFDRLEIYGGPTFSPLIGIQQGQSPDIDKVQEYYQVLESVLQYRPSNELPMLRVWINGQDSLPSVNAAMFETNAATGGLANVALRNHYFKTSREHIRRQIMRLSETVNNECADFSADPNNTYIQGFATPDGYQCGYSDTYMGLIAGNPKLKGLYEILGNVKAGPNTVHPFYLNYELPNSFISTPGIPVNFKHFNSNY